jgi:hypothetical protein
MKWMGLKDIFVGRREIDLSDLSGCDRTLSMTLVTPIVH